MAKGKTLRCDLLLLQLPRTLPTPTLFFTAPSRKNDDENERTKRLLFDLTSEMKSRLHYEKHPRELDIVTVASNTLLPRLSFLCYVRSYVTY